MNIFDILLELIIVESNILEVSVLLEELNFLMKEYYKL